MSNIPKVISLNAWDITTGDYTKPTNAAKKREKANDFILLTILKT